MAQDTGIEWTDHTFNPWWGCMKVSDGCKHCYAESLSKRFGKNIWGPAATTSRRAFGEKHWDEPLKWNKTAEHEGVRKRVFCASMADVFEDHPQVFAERLHLWNLIASTPMLDWQLLTKRPENILGMIPEAWKERPPANVWYGTSVENQEQADKRIPVLMRVPAVVRFLSCEPLLGPLWLGLADIHWVIAGGESGPGARPMDPAWVRSLRDQCQIAGVAFFFKQWGQHVADERQDHVVSYRKVGKKAAGRTLDGYIWNEFPQSRVQPSSNDVLSCVV